MDNEDQVILDVQQGKAESFRRLVERYQRPVFKMIFNLVGNGHAAEDISQDVFVAAYSKISTFDPMRCKFSTWLFTIARNKSINHLRRKKELLPSVREEPAAEGDPCRAACKEEFIQQLDDCLKQLPRRQQRAFVLAEFEDLPYEEIAQIECVSIGTVKSRIHRAKQKLRKALEQITGES
ncbi:MAG: RNA polymerase sigma factor [Planctomycetota bacterium]|jgi:RNA polymerase sigma-70 factor (ECF subfamily)